MSESPCEETMDDFLARLPKDHHILNPILEDIPDSVFEDFAKIAAKRRAAKASSPRHLSYASDLRQERAQPTSFDSFHRFQDLPTEVRLKIWRAAMPPRLSHIARLACRDAAWNCWPFAHCAPTPSSKLPRFTLTNQESYAEVMRIWEKEKKDELPELPGFNPHYDKLFLHSGQDNVVHFEAELKWMAGLLVRCWNASPVPLSLVTSKYFIYCMGFPARELLKLKELWMIAEPERILAEKELYEPISKFYKEEWLDLRTDDLDDHLDMAYDFETEYQDGSYDIEHLDVCQELLVELGEETGFDRKCFKFMVEK